MPYAIQVPPDVRLLLNALPSRVRMAVWMRLTRLAEMAEQWPPEDVRWEHLATPDADGLHFYVSGCCVRVRLEPEGRRLALHELGLIRVRLPGVQAGEAPGGREGSRRPMGLRH